jgi:hypothetical protein
MVTDLNVECCGLMDCGPILNRLLEILSFRAVDLQFQMPDRADDPNRETPGEQERPSQCDLFGTGWIPWHLAVLSGRNGALLNQCPSGFFSSADPYARVEVPVIGK